MTVPNHTIDPETGMIESKGYACAFDAERKLKFLEVFRNEGLGLYRTCRALGLSTSTIHHHYQIDSIFRKAFDEAKVEYTDELEATSRKNALNPKSVIERIFQLKALVPDKYGDQKTSGNVHISLNFDGKTLEMAKQRAQVIEAEIVDNQQAESAKKAEGGELPIITTAHATTNA